MGTTLHRSALPIAYIACSLLASAPSRAAASVGPDDLHRAVVKMRDLSESLGGQLGSVTDSIERSRRIRETVRQNVADTIDLELSAELACVSHHYLALARPNSIEEELYESVYMEIVRRLASDPSSDAQRELREIRGSVIVDGASALVLFEAYEKQGMKW